MSEHTIVILTVLRLLTIGFGVTFLAFTLKAYRRHRTRAMLVLMVAIALMIGGAVVEGAAVQFLRLDLDVAHVTEATLTLLAFMVLVGSVLSARIEARGQHVDDPDAWGGEDDGAA